MFVAVFASDVDRIFRIAGVSRRNYTYKGFYDLTLLFGQTLKVKSAVIDSEIYSLDAKGRSIFNQLSSVAEIRTFYAFDLVRG